MSALSQQTTKSSRVEIRPGRRDRVGLPGMGDGCDIRFSGLKMRDFFRASAAKDGSASVDAWLFAHFPKRPRSGFIPCTWRKRRFLLNRPPASPHLQNNRLPVDAFNNGLNLIA